MMSDHKYISKTNEMEQIALAGKSATSSVNTATNFMNPRTLQKANDTLEIAEEIISEAQTHVVGVEKMVADAYDESVQQAHHQLRQAELSEENSK